MYAGKTDALMYVEILKILKPFIDEVSPDGHRLFQHNPQARIKISCSLLRGERDQLVVNTTTVSRL